MEKKLEADDDTKEVGVEVRSEPGSGQASNWSVTSEWNESEWNSLLYLNTRPL